MNINLDDVGAAAAKDGAGHWRVHFGTYLPGITFDQGYRVQVRVIHERDQFTRGIEPRAFDLFWHNGSALDLWDTTVDLTANAAGNFGQDGTYLYRFQLLRGAHVVTVWFSDPFGRATGRGTLSAFTIDSNAQPFAWSDGEFLVPEVDDLVVYEMHVGEFNDTFGGVVAQLGYLTSLRVNALELMPVTTVKEDVEWGYTPLSYFAPDDRYGGPTEMKRLVNACHQQGIAVVLDSVYAHAHPEFAYNLVYETSGEPNPMMGRFAEEFFSRPGMDYTKEFTRDYFFTANRYWMEEYHIDGFRYDYVPGMLDGPAGNGYANLVFRTYRHAQEFALFPRFDTGEGRSRIIQCAEHLPDARGILRTTYSNTCWSTVFWDNYGHGTGRCAAAGPSSITTTPSTSGTGSSPTAATPMPGFRGPRPDGGRSRSTRRTTRGHPCWSPRTAKGCQSASRPITGRFTCTVDYSQPRRLNMSQSTSAVRIISPTASG